MWTGGISKNLLWYPLGKKKDWGASRPSFFCLKVCNILLPFWVIRMADHELILTGPYPYFSTPEIFFGECTCGSWSAGKDSELRIRKRHAQHAVDKEEPNSHDWDSNYERQLRKL